MLPPCDLEVSWRPINPPLVSAVRQERILAIADALERLPKQQRQVVILRYWEGLSHRQLAEEMGKSTTAIAGLLNRGTNKLRGLLAGINQQ